MLVRFEQLVNRQDTERLNVPETTVMLKIEDQAKKEIMDLILKVCPIKKGDRQFRYGEDLYTTSFCIMTENQFTKIANMVTKIKSRSGSKETVKDLDFILEQLKNVFGDGKQG